MKRVLKEDLPDAPAWVDPWLYIQNTFFESIYRALNRDITFAENIRSKIKELSFTTLSTYVGTAATFDTLTFPHDLKVKPTGLLLLQIKRDNVSQYTPIEGDIYVDWQEENGEIQIGLIRGLAASTAYVLKVLVF